MYLPPGQVPLDLNLGFDSETFFWLFVSHNGDDITDLRLGQNHRLAKFVYMIITTKIQQSTTH